MLMLFVLTSKWKIGETFRPNATTIVGDNQWQSQPDNFVMLCKFLCVYRPYKQSISKEINNDNDLNLHSMTKLSGWLRYH